jgi:cytochrome P450
VNGSTVPVLPTEPGVDPHRMYAEMREKDLVLLTREPNGLRRWLVLGYAEGREVLADDRLSKDPGLAWEQLRDAGYVTGEPGQRANYLYHLANTDPPDHTRLRRLISEAFTVRRVEQMRPRVRQIADRLLDDMEPLRTVDLVECYSHPLATMVMSEILGGLRRDACLLHRVDREKASAAGRRNLP